MKKMTRVRCAKFCSVCGDKIPKGAMCHEYKRGNQNFHICLRCMQYLNKHKDMKASCKTFGVELGKELQKWTPKYSNVKITKLDNKISETGYKKIEEDDNFVMYEKKETLLRNNYQKIFTVFIDYEDKIVSGYCILYNLNNACMKEEEFSMTFDEYELFYKKLKKED